MRHSQTITAVTIVSLMLGFVPVASADETVSPGLVLEPHCLLEDRTNCPVYQVKDASHLTTGTLQAGDILDVDVVLTNGFNQPIKTVRSWLSYDSKTLDVRNVSLTPVLSQPIPGEQTADPTLGIVKIGGAEPKLQNNRMAIARVTFQVKTGANSTSISFSNFRDDGLGQVALNGDPVNADVDGRGLSDLPCIDKLICQKKITPLLKTEPSALSVMVESNHAAAPIEAATDAPVIAAVPQNESLPTNNIPASASESSFRLLQVQNLRVTSKENSIFLGWLPLRSSELAGYNVYFSTVSGKYIQRRTVGADATSLVLRDLEQGTTYFVAIRAFNKSEQESVYSQEVSVTVGDAESSSAPLTVGSLREIPVSGNPIESRGGKEINGSTGLGDTLVFFLVICAMVGTGFAANRKYV